MSSDNAPGAKAEQRSPKRAVIGYVTGLVLAALLTTAAFLLPTTDLVWAPALPVALVALAVGQMGVHLVFFLHITTGPDNTNNILALAFGLLIVGLVLVGSIWIMAHLNQTMMPMDALSRMQR